MDDDKPPHLTLASSNEDRQVKERRELEFTNWILRRHAANFLRVMRGAGRPEQLFDDLNELVKTIRSMDDVSVWAFNEHYAAVLRDAFGEDIDERGVAPARRTIARGVLQMLASELAGHNTQKIRGQHEISEGVQEMTEAWEESRSRYQEEWEARHPVRPVRAISRKPRKQSKKPKPKPAPAPPVEEPEFTGSAAEFMRKRAEQLKGKKKGED